MKMTAPTTVKTPSNASARPFWSAIRTGLSGQRVAVREPPLEQVRQSARQERDRPQAGDQPPLQRRPEPSFREREQQVDEGRQEQASEQPDEPDHPAVVALVETGGRPQRADEDHQPARAVVGLLGPGDQAADHERQRDHREDDGDRGVVASRARPWRRRTCRPRSLRAGPGRGRARAGWRGSSVLADQRCDGLARELVLGNEPAGAARLDERAEIAGRHGSRRG